MYSDVPRIVLLPSKVNPIRNVENFGCNRIFQYHQNGLLVTEKGAKTLKNKRKKFGGTITVQRITQGLGSRSGSSQISYEFFQTAK